MDVAVDSLKKARNYLKENNYGRAFAHYLVVLQLVDDNKRKEFGEEFKSIWWNWQSILFDKEEYDSLIKCFELAVVYFNDVSQDLNRLGVQLLRSQKLLLAKKFFEKALSHTPDHLPTAQNLQRTKNSLVERWHFRMLNDQVRNQSYLDALKMEALKNHCNHNNKILDIGTGTGILSIFAAQNFISATKVVACDTSEIMIQIAEKVIQLNGMNDIKLVNDHSTKLQEKFSVVVTEIFDSGIFGESIIQTLVHAWENLIPKNGRVIPSHIEIYITGIQHKKLFNRENQILKLNQLCITQNTEPYDTENLTHIKYLSDVQMGLKVNFNDVTQLKDILKTHEKNPKVTLTCIEDGYIDSFAIWFKLFLNETVSITNDPRQDQNSCWEQAVIHIAHPIPVSKRMTLTVKLSCVDGLLKIWGLPPNEKDYHTCFKVDRNEMAFLNDHVLHEKSFTFFETYSDNMEGKKVLDLAPVPIFGLECFRRGGTLYCNVRDSTKQIIKAICTINNLNYKKINFLTESNFSVIEMYDVIFQNLIEVSGLVDENEVEASLHWRDFLKPDNGLFIPEEVNIWAQLIYCEWLENVTKVDDKNCCGLKIAEVINEFKTMEQRDINVSDLKFTEISISKKIGSLKLDMKKRYENETTVEILNEGEPNAILYWFEINLFEDETIFTNRDGSFANVSAFMLDNQKLYKKNDLALLNLVQHEGLLRIYCDN